MKKIISMLIVCMMLFSCVGVWAADTPNLDFLKQSATVSDVEQKGTMSIKLNAPFGLLEVLEEENSGTMSNYIDIVMLVESLFDTTFSVDAKAKVSDDGKTRLMEAHLKSDIPFKANDNLAGNVKANFSYWSSFDFSDEENPYFDVIMTHPFAAKYITADSELMLENGSVISEDVLETYKTVFDNEKIKKLNDKMISSIEKNASITGNSKKVRISFTDIGLKMYIMDILTAFFEEIDGNMPEDFDEGAIKDAFTEVPIFGNEALVMEYTLDSKGRITGEKTVLNVDFNIYDMMVSLGEEEPPEESGITREKCNLNFTVSANTDFNYDSVSINFPELTEDNSIDIFEYSDPYYYDEPVDDYYREEYDPYYPWPSASIDENCFESGAIKYVQLRSFFEDMGYDVQYDNGYIRAKIASVSVKYKEFCFSIGSDVVYTDKHNVDINTPLFVKDGTTYVSIEDCENLTGMVKSSIDYYFEGKHGWIYFYDPQF